MNKLAQLPCTHFKQDRKLIVSLELVAQLASESSINCVGVTDMDLILARANTRVKSVVAKMNLDKYSPLSGVDIINNSVEAAVHLVSALSWERSRSSLDQAARSV